MTLRTVGFDDKNTISASLWCFCPASRRWSGCPDAEGARRARPGSTPRLYHGYRGSPLGGARPELSSAPAMLEPTSHRVPCRPQRGSGGHRAVGQPAGGDARRRRAIDGVFGIWYGKAPGVDRSGDVFRHANPRGSKWRGARDGGRRSCAKSSTVPHQCEFALVDAMMPCSIRPAFRKSSITGSMGLPCRAIQAAGSASNACMTGRIDRRDRARTRPPEDRDAADFKMPPAVSISAPAMTALEQEQRLHPSSASPRWLLRRPTARPDRVYAAGQPEDRHRLGRQELSRRAPGA